MSFVRYPGSSTTLDTGGEVKNDAHSELAFAELRPKIRLRHQYPKWATATLQGIYYDARLWSF